MLNMEKLVEIYQSYFPFCLGKVELKNEQLQTQRMHLIHFDSTDSCCRRPQNPGSLFVDVCCSLSKRKPRDEVAGQSTDPGIPGIPIFPPPPRSSAAATRASEPSPAPPSADPPWLRRRRCPGRLGPAAPWHGGGGKPPAWRRCIQRGSTWLVKYGQNMV